MTHTKNIPQAVFDAAWDGFAGTDWRDKSSVDRFVQANYTPYDGISLTTQVAPKALGKTFEEQVESLVTILDGYFESGGQHMNLNVLNLDDVRDKIMAGEDVIVRISGYCVNTKYLTDEQRRELTGRVFHEVLSL